MNAIPIMSDSHSNSLFDISTLLLISCTDRQHYMGTELDDDITVYYKVGMGND